MEKEDCDRMTASCSKLVRAINWREIWPKLFEHKIFRADDKNVPRWQEDLDNFANNLDIYLKIKTRGPNAFESFVKCLIEIGRQDLANILKPEDGNDEPNDRRSSIIPPVNENNNTDFENEGIEDELGEHDNFYKRLQYTKEPLKVNVRKSTQFMNTLDTELCYDMRSNPRGLVLIINNIIFTGQSDRLAAEHDENNVKSLFEQIGFKVMKICRNLTSTEMLRRLETFSKNPKLHFVHALFVVIMSHGNEHVVDNRSQSVVCGIDNQFITDMQILNFFTALTCKDMCKKPKVFIFQTCRGEKSQKAVNASNVRMGRHETDIRPFIQPNLSQTQSSMPKSTQDYSDMIVAYSTLPGYKAHRDTFTGSWFIQALCEVIMNHAHNKDLCTLFKMTDRRLAEIQTDTNECQTSVVTSYGFNKKLYLNPGFFETGNDT